LIDIQSINAISDQLVRATSNIFSKQRSNIHNNNHTSLCETWDLYYYYYSYLWQQEDIDT